MKYKEIILKSENELRHQLTELRNEVRDLSVKLRLNQLKNHTKLKAAKKDIARILTYLHNKPNQQ